MGTIQIDGSTPKLTIGNATAEDATILFDGNAQDFYIALDDSADDLLIGLGSTVGSTPAISIDENLAVKTYGDITMTGTTPTLTIGDAGAEDTAIVFDGNAQDFYIALDDSADDLLIGLGSTVGTTPAISIDENLQSTFGGDVIIGGATPTLTIGDAGAEDTKIVFDGNAQDFHIGLDDSSDDLVIGLGSTLGTTSHIVIDETGAVTMPLQPAFSATATSSNIPLTTQTTIDLSERFDTNADLSSNTFTAPVTGKYYLSYHFYLTSLDADHTVLDVKIVTSNRTHGVTYKPSVIFSADANFSVTGSQICDMDASDTATFVIYIVGGEAQTDVHGDSTASGMLIG